MKIILWKNSFKIIGRQYYLLYLGNLKILNNANKLIINPIVKLYS